MPDVFNLHRFVEAQDRVFETVLSELASGEKKTHWMWFVFPQVLSLGYTDDSDHYAIRSLDEARAYLSHPVLGPRLQECVRVVIGLPKRTAGEVFGFPDVQKFRSCLTLFSLVCADDCSIFDRALNCFYAAQRCKKTLRVLGV